MTPQDRQNYGEAGNVTIVPSDGAITPPSPQRFCKIVTVTATVFTALVDQFEQVNLSGTPATDLTYPANFELVGSFTTIHLASGSVRAYFAADRK